MQITRSASAPFEGMEAANFNGTARRRDLGAFSAPACRILAVSFEPGARTHWHSHADGQVLYVLAGRGRVGTRQGGHDEIGPGDLVYAPPGEEHWHGAAADAEVTHLAFSFGDTVWGGAVAD